MTAWPAPGSGRPRIPNTSITREEYDAMEAAGLITRPITWPPGRTAQDPKPERIEEVRP